MSPAAGQPPALKNPSLLPSESSQQIHSLKGSQRNMQICRFWFLAQVQTTFVPEICFRVFFAKRACAEPCARRRWFPTQPAPRSLCQPGTELGAWVPLLSTLRPSRELDDQGNWNEMSFKAPYNPNHPMNL